MSLADKETDPDVLDELIALLHSIHNFKPLPLKLQETANILYANLQGMKTVRELSKPKPRVPSGIIGIKNPGVNCYINSVL